MAVLRAFQSTDMRAELGFGIPVSVTGFEVVIANIDTTTTFEGRFAFPGPGVVTSATFVDGTDFFLPPRRGIEGTLDAYDQDLLEASRFAVEDFEVDAFQAFFALFRLDDTDLFQSLVFAGNDTLQGSRRGDVLIGYAGRDKLWGYGGDDALTGGIGNDTLYGLAGADALAGDDGRDQLWGGAGDDLLSGGRGRDKIAGEKGRDVLTGGLDADKLKGGADADTFRFLSIADSKPGSRRDKIGDFRNGDEIDLSAIDANASEDGNQAFVFIGDAAFTGVAGQLRFSGKLVQGDTDGNGKADFEIKLSGGVDLDAADFLL
jgi:Ca2+-binding RTX toxin-like protein